MKSNSFFACVAVAAFCTAMNVYAQVESDPESAEDKKVFDAIGQVGRFVKDDEGYLIFEGGCSAALIANDKVISEGYCLYDEDSGQHVPEMHYFVHSKERENIVIKLQESPTRNWKDLASYGITVRKISSGIFYPGKKEPIPGDPDLAFEYGFEKNDIAISQLASPINFLTPIQVANAKLTRSIASGDEMIVVNYDRFAPFSDDGYVPLKKLAIDKLQALSYESCSQRVTPSNGSKLSKKFICAYAPQQPKPCLDSSNNLYFYRDSEGGKLNLAGFPGYSHQANGRESCTKDNTVIELSNRMSGIAGWFDWASGLSYSIK